jgi:hypothetical protein
MTTTTIIIILIIYEFQHVGKSQSPFKPPKLKAKSWRSAMAYALEQANK